MKSYWMQSDGHQAVIEMRDTQIPVPGPDQLLIRVRAAGLNRGEFILGHGLHKAGAAKPIGMEAAGELVSMGALIQDFNVGDRIMGRCSGAFAEYALISNREAMKMPDSMNWFQAAAIPLTALVVFDMLVVYGKISAGEWVLIPGVSSGVGVTALAMAKAFGAKVIGTSGSTEKLTLLKNHGLDEAICTRNPDFHEKVMSITHGNGVDIVINTVGGSVFAECIKSMAFQGRLATVGYVDGVLKAEIDLQALHTKRLEIFGVSNKLRTPEQRAQILPAFREQILPLFQLGKALPLISEIIPFEGLLKAKEVMDSNQHVGKIILAGVE